MIRILTDASSDYTADEIKEKNLEFVPITITFGNTLYTEGKNLTRSEFYERLTNDSEAPKTSQPSPQAFLDIFEDAKQKGDDLICILLSSALSGTYQSALLAKNMADYDNIYLIDSLSATYVIKVLADHACALAAAGVSAKEIVSRIEKLKSRVKVIAVLDTLEYLCRGGRISRTAAAIGEMANVKPMITITPEGTIGILGKSLGKTRAVSHCAAHLQAEDLDPSFPLYSLYSYGTKNCEKFERQLTAKGYCITKRLQIGTVIGAHIGPEAFGAVYVTK